MRLDPANNVHTGSSPGLEQGVGKNPSLLQGFAGNQDNQA